jgi:hypothetical protein
MMGNNVSPALLTALSASRKACVRDALKGSMWRSWSILGRRLLFVQKFVVMGEGFKWTVMTVIPRVVMDVLILVK